VAIGYGCGFIFGVIMGYVVFKTRRPAWFLKMVEDQWSLNASRTKKIGVLMQVIITTDIYCFYCSIISIKVVPFIVLKIGVDIGTTLKWQIHSVEDNTTNC